MLRIFTIPVALATFVLQVRAQNLQDCYAYDGEVTTNNVVCEGSGACCNAQATCTEQRLCHNAGDPDDVFVRGPCNDIGWESLCPQVCQYEEGTNNFPRVTQCDDGSWCCHNQNNVTDTRCCDEGRGTFLNERGEVVDAPSTTSSSAATSTTPSASTSATSSPTPEPDNGSLSTGARIGIGVGVGGGVLGIAGVVLAAWFLMKRPRQAHHNNKEASSMDHLQPGGFDDVRAHYSDNNGQFQQNSYYKPPAEWPPAEAPGSVPGRLHADQGRVEADSSPYVGELPAEVPNGQRGAKRQA